MVQQAPAEEAGGLDWRKLLAALLRHKWLVLACVLLGIAGGVIGMRVTPAEYIAQGTVWVQPAPSTRGPIQEGQLLGSMGWVELMKSYVVLDETVRRAKLFVNFQNPSDSLLFADFDLASRFALGDFTLVRSPNGLTLKRGEDTVLEEVAVGDSIGRSLGFAWAPRAGMMSKDEVKFSVVNPRDVSRQLGTDVGTQMLRDGNFLRVALQGSDPQRIAKTINVLLDRFIEVATDLKREKVSDLAGILQTQMKDAEANLRNAELALQLFKVETITLPSEASTPVAVGLQMTQTSVFGNFFGMQVSREETRRDIDALDRAIVEMADSTFNPASIEVIPAVQGNAELTRALTDLTDQQAELHALRTRYTDDYPATRQLAQEVRNLRTSVIPDLAMGLRTELAARAAALDAQIGAAGGELARIPPRAIQEARLERDVAIAEDLYSTLQKKYEEARLAELSSIPDVRILDPAIVPQNPLRNTGWRMLAMGVLGGLGLAGALVFLLDRMDRRVRYPEQITKDLGLSILGVVPRLKVGKGAKPFGDVMPVIESMRGIRLNLLHARGSSGPFAVTVTSPGVGDGKSFVSSNMALAFADAGYRTLLIDGDSRRGALHRVLGTQRKPGLTDALAQNQELPSVIQRTQYDRLDFIGCGTRLSGAPELFGSSRMAEAVAALRQQYEVIIFDSPPLGAGVDAFGLGHLSDFLMIVLRTGQTDRSFAEAKLDMLERLRIRVLGAVLNDVQDDAASSMYGYGYYSYYMPGYESADETEDEGDPTKLIEQAG
jgi:capsular exopolysaccharide synthesis family protein